VVRNPATLAVIGDRRTVPVISDCAALTVTGNRGTIGMVGDVPHRVA
jgi:hypothetical protein